MTENKKTMALVATEKPQTAKARRKKYIFTGLCAVALLFLIVSAILLSGQTQTVGFVFLGLGCLLVIVTGISLIPISRVKPQEVEAQLNRYDFSLDDPDYVFYDRGQYDIAVWAPNGDRVYEYEVTDEIPSPGDESHFDLYRDAENGIQETLRFTAKKIVFAADGIVIDGENLAYENWVVRVETSCNDGEVSLRLIFREDRGTELWLPFTGKTAALCKQFPLQAENQKLIDYILTQPQNAFTRIMKYGTIKRV